MQCGGYGQVGRPTDAGREGGRRAVVHATPASLSESFSKFPVPDGAQPRAGGRFGAGSLLTGVPGARKLRAERKVHHLAFPDRHEFGVELGAGHALPANEISLDAPVTVDAEEGEEKTLDIAEKHQNIEQHLVEETRKKMIRHAIEKLPEKQRAAVLLHKYQELDYGEIAKILQCSESALKSLLFRAYETLRVELAPLVAQQGKS